MDITPFPFQHTGAEWLATKRHALLADEMGLGKTVQAVMAARDIGAKRIVVVCPAVARFTWVRHLEWAGYSALPIVSRNDYDMSQHYSAIVVSYDLVDLGYLPAWIDVLIIDESHFLKSLAAQRTKKIYGKSGLIHRAKHVWNLSGTPAPNHAGELWPMLYVFGRYKDSYESFVEKFCTVRPTPFGESITGTKNIPELKKLMAGFVLRRQKADVLKDLPAITFADLPLRGAAVKDFEQLTTEDIEALERMYEQAPASLRREVGLAKVDSVVDLVKQELDSGGLDKVVLFCIHREVIARLEQALAWYGAVSLHGGTSPNAREHNIRRFQHEHGCRVFIGQLIAAGTNITLTAAANVIVVEATSVPGDVAQAVMRVHRIGQTRPVLARFASLGGTSDECLQANRRRKTKQLVELFDKEIL